VTERPAEIEKLSPAERRELLEKLLREKAGLPRSAPLSLAQERLWFLAQVQPGDPFYNITALISLEGELDVSSLSSALREMVLRHETLRTTFRSVEGTPEQVIAREGEVDFVLRPLDDVESGSRANELERLARVESERPFDLERGPLARFVLARLSPEEHLLVVTMHHIISDGWSVYNLMREVAALYHGFHQGVAPALPSLPIQYADFARWQRRWIQSAEFERQLDYWKRQLAHLPTLDLPADRARPPVQRFRGSNLPISIPGELSAGLRRLARENGVTLFTTLLAAFNVLITRYTQQTDVVVGTPVAARSRTETENLIGFIVNVLVLRIDTSGPPTFREHLQRVHQVSIEAFSHQDLPFEKLVEEIKPERDLSRNPLFQVAFTVQNMPEPVIELPRLRMSPPTLPGFTFAEPGVGTSRTRVDMEWHLMDREERIDGTVVFDTDLFDPETVERMITHFLTLLQGAVENPDIPISRLPLLTADEKRRMLFEWNETAGSYRDDQCFHELLERQARNRPSLPAATFGPHRLTYGELNRRANQLAHHLRELGVKAEVPVGICLNRSFEMLVAVYGVLKAGGAYVPLEPTYPAERLQFLVEDSGAKIVVVSRDLVSRLPLTAARVVELDLDRSRIESQSIENPAPVAGPDNLAYVIFTSGSTGKPKGVLLRHRGMLNLSRAMEDVFPLGPFDGVLQFASLSYDASVWEIVMAATFGARLCLGERESMVPGPALSRLLEDQAVSVVTMPPSVLASLEPKELKRLRVVIAAGEACSKELAARWAEGRRFFNAYGPTETTVCATVAECRAGDEHLTIGKPLVNFRCHVLDGSGEPVPVGVSGELSIGGESLARGYLNQESLTAAQFIPDPFARGGERDPRLYRTGDLVRYRPDGSLQYLGRLDHQVKVRGFRVEPGEIERVLEQHPGVKEAVVLHRTIGSGAKALAAYWVARETPPSASDLRRFLRDKLPEFMVPPHFISLPELPLTANGKVDRGALPDPAGLPDPESEFAHPRGELEARVADIWKKLLDRDRVGRDESFFDIGGHSLLLLRLHNEIRVAFGQEIPILDLFRLPTVEALASRLDGGRRQPVEADLVRRGLPREAGPVGAVAVIAASGRFPGAPSLLRFWENLCQGVESVRFFDDHELERSGVDPSLYRRPEYVRSAAVLEDAELFDASFFGYSEKEAKLIDPQQRLFLECAWELFEAAGYDPHRYRGAVGVFAGASGNEVRAGETEAGPSANGHRPVFGADRNFLSTRVSYKLDLRGPSLYVQTGCSTSLVAVHLAVRSLQLRECDMAIAGGVSIQMPQEQGYLYYEGGIGSPDGRCRPFDADARGGFAGNGLGMVLLKRLDEALADGDEILAVVKGSSINNDGARKVGYSAPSFDGQVAVVAASQGEAAVSPETIGYIETHGTGTPLGDAIEIAALTEVFQAGTSKTGFCAVGSVKPNIGHLNAAAGVASLIKAILALHHKAIPPSLHFRSPNPEIDFASSPFYVNDRLRPWPAAAAPRRAGVSSFGVGGTNAHLVLEEAPPLDPSGPSRRWQLLALSGKTPAALDRATNELLQYLDLRPDREPVKLADAAYTLQVGRAEQRFRRVLLCRDAREAADAWTRRDPARIFEGSHEGASESVAFHFLDADPRSSLAGLTGLPGRQLYETEATYREHVDRCFERLRALFGLDLPESLFALPNEEGQRNPIRRRASLFVTESALALLWKEWGVEPEAVFARGDGRYAAAFSAGALSLDEALEWVAQPNASGVEPWDRLRERAVVPLFLGDEIPLDGPRVRLDLPTIGDGPEAELRTLLESLGRLWAAGVAVDWNGFTRYERRRRIPLPTYPFERKRYS
jgi:amino acid adenylation domain-containing protein